MQWTPYVLPHLLATGICAVGAVIAWPRRRMPAAGTILLMLVVGALWAVGNAFEMISITLDDKVLWAGLQYPTISALPVLWFLFALQYTDRREWLTRRRVASLFLVPAITVLLMATNGEHGLMRYGISLDESGPFSTIVKSYGPWFYVYALYSHSLLIAGTAILLESLVRSHLIYRLQGLSVFAAVILPLGVNLSYIFGYSPLPGMDLTPLAFAVAGLIILLSMVRFQMLDLVPAARTQVVESMGDGVIVLDPRGRVVDLNLAGAVLLGLRPEAAIGLRGADLTTADPALRGRLADLQETRGEVATGDDGRQESLDVAITPIRRRGRASGWVVVLRDVTERRRVEKEKEALIVELKEALARVKTLSGLIPICASCKKIRDDQGYWQQVEQYVKAHSQADFTHAICPDCMKELYPDIVLDEADGS